MSKKYYMPNHLLELGDMPMHQKMLHMILWERAVCIGFAKINWEIFSGMAGRYSFCHKDIAELHPWVWPHGVGEVFLPNYLKIQTPTLSKTSRSCGKIWDELKNRFGATRENTAPYLLFLKDKGFRHLAPDIPDEYSGEGPKPTWYVKHEERLKKAQEYPEPSWPDELLTGYRRLLDNYISRAKNITSKSDAEHEFYLDANRIENAQSQIQQMINDGIGERIIIQQINQAIDKNRLFVYTPRWN